ncbi:MAG: ABC transporter ATP-binding protein [Stellaceae bacterium]
MTVLGPSPAMPARTSVAAADILTVRHLTKSVGARGAVLDIIADIDFAVREGEFVSMVGPSGCGKTTLLMCLAGLLPASGGAIDFLGAPLSGPATGVSVVFQDYSRSLLPWKSNLDNVIFGMRRVTDASRGEKRGRARELLASLGLAGFEEHYPWQVSGGMQQRVANARALASRSRLLLLDEPLAAVDAQTRAEMQDLLLDLAARYHQTCLLVTHDVDEAVYIADRVLVLARRPTRIVADLPVPLAKPRDQIETREERVYLDIRHDVLSRIRAMKNAAPRPRYP